MNLPKVHRLYLYGALLLLGYTAYYIATNEFIPSGNTYIGISAQALALAVLFQIEAHETETSLTQAMTFYNLSKILINEQNNGNLDLESTQLYEITQLVERFEKDVLYHVLRETPELGDL